MATATELPVTTPDTPFTFEALHNLAWKAAADRETLQQKGRCEDDVKLMRSANIHTVSVVGSEAAQHIRWVIDPHAEGACMASVGNGCTLRYENDGDSARFYALTYCGTCQHTAEHDIRCLADLGDLL